MADRFVVALEHKTVPADAGPGEITGYASTYGNIDLQDDVMEAGALAKTVADWSRAKAKVPLLDSHGEGLSRLIGSVLELASTAKGLWFRAGFAGTPAAQEARRLAQEGHLSGVSIGYLPIRASHKSVGGRLVRVLHEVRLLEISLTPIPANPEAQLASVKSGLGYTGYAGGVDDDAADAGRQLAELEAWAAQAVLGELVAAPASVWQAGADARANVEAATMAADLEAWAGSAEVAAATRRDPARATAERDQARAAQANTYANDLADWTAAQARTPSPCGGRCAWCRAGAPSACTYRAASGG